MNTRANAAVEYDEEMSAIISPRQERKKTRRVKQKEGTQAVHKEKFIEGEVAVPSKGIEFSPRGENQKRLLRYLREGRQQVFSTGVVGSGKSVVSVYHAATLLKQKKIDKIFLLRPNVSCGKSHGAVPGDLHQKLMILFGQTIAHFEKFLGVGYTKYCIDKKIIELASIEYLRGYSFENCIVIVEESQGLTEDQFEMVMTRAGSNSQIVYTGDARQAHVSEQSGLKKTIKMLEDALRFQPDYLSQDDLTQLYNNIGVVEFGFDDIQRSPVVKALAKLYYYK